MKIEADKYSGCIIYWIALYIDKWIKENWLSWGLVMRYGLLHLQVTLVIPSKVRN